jgi:ABC-2 type transport system ATP-binding protein
VFVQHQGIIAAGLTKRFDSVLAVDNVSFEVQPGEVYGFLGPNGAGKSTTVAMLTTLSRPTSGSVKVGGFDTATQAANVRTVAGVALQEIGLDPLMTSAELLVLQARMFGMTGKEARIRAEQLIDLVDLRDAIDRRVGKYSGGMRRRLDLAMALVHAPKILFLDEPTTGLDPASRRSVWQEIRRLNKDLGMTIFLTTQYLEEADSLADRVAIIDDGKIVVEGTPEGLKSQMGGESINLSFSDEPTVAVAQTELESQSSPLAIERIQTDQLTLRLYLRNAAAAVPAVINHLESVQLRPNMLTLSKPTLDDVFLSVTGHRYDRDPQPSNLDLATNQTVS